jgi:hypothetical protein
MPKVETGFLAGAFSSIPLSDFFQQLILLYKSDRMWPRIILRTDGMLIPMEFQLLAIESGDRCIRSKIDYVCQI